MLGVGLDIAYLCTNFDHCIFSRSGDMIGAHQNLMVHVISPPPFHGLFVIRGLGLAMIN